MAYIPSDASWYLADLVVEHRIAGDERNVVHTNSVLIRADSPEEAYEKALWHGQQAAHSYLNTDEQQVDALFRGLRNVYVIYGDLEDGTEILYSEDIAVPEEELQAWIVPKKQLAIFEERKPASPSSPNYMPKSIMDALLEAGFTEDALSAPPAGDEEAEEH